jgi:DNA-binding FadR family transcriptional regulator
MAGFSSARPPLSRRSLADQVCEAIVEDYITSGLREGDALPSSAELSARYGVSRTVVREALAVLAGRGMLSSSQGRETVVLTPGAAELSRIVKVRMDREDVSLNDLVAVRLGLEVTAARSAAHYLTEASSQTLRAAAERLAAAPDEKEYQEADIAIHRAIAVASSNALVVMILDSLTELLMEFRVRASRYRHEHGHDRHDIVAEHVRIVELILDRDADGAAEAMREHLESAARDVLAG